MPRNFYFGTDADIVAGAANFASLISASASSYGLTSAQSAAFGALNATLQSAYAAAVNPSTRTPVAVESKNLAVRDMRASAILLAKIAYATAAVTDVQLTALGLLPRAVRTPRAVPAAPPDVGVVAVVGRVAKIRLTDATSGRRGIAFGAAGANLYSFVGPEAPADPRQYHFEGMTTRAITEILFPNSVASGATVWLSACWVGGRGQTSVAGAPVSFTLQGGPVRAAA